MASTYSEYSIDAEIASFFSKTSATRSACDARAKELAGGNVVPVKVQGACSYSVYAGVDLEYVVQFRLKSLELRAETTTLARNVYGSLVPEVAFKGQIGEAMDEKEPLYVYLMSRIRGKTHLDFVLAYGRPANSPENFERRRILMADLGRFFALSWRAPQQVETAYRSRLAKTYIKELQILLSALPDRFRPTIQNCIKSMDDIFSLPMVLLHRDFGTCNIMVDETSCHLVGIIDWAEAEICPFGLNLHSLEALTGDLHLRNGWTRYEDYDALQGVFWDTFKQEAGILSEKSVRAINVARITGLLLSCGFTSRLASEPEPVPIGDDERARYNMLSLDGFLIDPVTRFQDFHLRG